MNICSKCIENTEAFRQKFAPVPLRMLRIPSGSPSAVRSQYWLNWGMDICHLTECTMYKQVCSTVLAESLVSENYITFQTRAICSVTTMRISNQFYTPCSGPSHSTSPPYELNSQILCILHILHHIRHLYVRTSTDGILHDTIPCKSTGPMQNITHLQYITQYRIMPCHTPYFIISMFDWLINIGFEPLRSRCTKAL
jgi:hypothetical protein